MKRFITKIFKFILSILQYIFVAFIGLGAAYSVEVGHWFLLAFALYAIFIKQDSRLTFGAALFLILTVPFFQLTNQHGIADNMAVYVFELLVVGTLHALVELRYKS